MAVDFDYLESSLTEFFVPPDQVVSEGRAVFSEVELQPHHLALEVLQNDFLLPAKPMNCPRNKFRRLLPNVGVVIEFLSGGRGEERTSQQQTTYGDKRSSMGHVIPS